jgi:GAF domain-containing protein
MAKSRFALIVRILFVVVGLAGAFFHIMATWDEQWPNADLVTMAWLAFAALGILLPSIRAIDFPGGGGVKFRAAVQAGQEGIADLESALGEATQLLQSWLAGAAWLNTYLQREDVDDDTAASAVFRYCLERMEEAKDWMGDADEPIRISLWWYDSGSDELYFTLSNDIRDELTKDFRFKPGSGLMGQAFAENRTYNVDDAPSSAFYMPIRDTAPGYRGLLLVPVRIMDEALGMISIDREQKRTFSANAENVAGALAEQVSYAFMHPRVRTIMVATPERVNALLLSWHVQGETPALHSTPSPSSEDSAQPPA